MASGLNLTVNDIMIQTPKSAPNTTILQAGFKNGTQAGIAAIGTFTNDSTARSNINITTGKLEL